MGENFKVVLTDFYDHYLLRDFSHTFSGGLLVFFILHLFYPNVLDALKQDLTFFNVSIFLLFSYVTGILHQELILLPHRICMLKSFKNKDPKFTTRFYFYRTSTDCDKKTQELYKIYNEIFKENNNQKITINEYLINYVIGQEMGQSARRSIERTVFLKQLSIEIGGFCLTALILLLLKYKFRFVDFKFWFIFPLLSLFLWFVNNYFVNYQIIQYIGFLKHLQIKNLNEVKNSTSQIENVK